MTMHTAGWLEARVPDWDGPRNSDLMEPGPRWEAIFYVEPFITWEYEDLCRRVGANQPDVHVFMREAIQDQGAYSSQEPLP